MEQRVSSVIILQDKKFDMIVKSFKS